MQNEKYLYQRIVAQAALRSEFFDELLERQVLVRVRAQRDFFGLSDKVTKTRIPRQPASQWQGIGKKADEAFDFRMIAVRDRNANHNIFLATVARE